MKVIFALVFVLAAITLASSQSVTPVINLNQNLAVYTTATNYTLFSLGVGTQALATLVVSSPSATAASTVSVNTVATLPSTAVSSSSAINGGLPAGYSSSNFGITLSPTQTAVGLYVNFSSDINGNANAQLNINPSIFGSGSLNTSVVASFAPLSFNASSNTYYQIPSSMYNISATGGIQMYLRSSLYIVLAVQVPNTTYNLAITNGATAYANLVANTATNFAVVEATRTALYLYNVTASAGTLAVSVSSNAANEGAAASQLLVSSIYNFTHSAGSSASVSAQLYYSLANTNFNSTIQNNAGWYTYNNGQWNRQGGSVQGNAVVYNTNHFSDWSVQSNNNGAGGAGAKLEVPFFAHFLSALF